MTAVALIGGDGAGKTTIAHMVTESFGLPVRYLYMGVNAQSSNVSLPTTRLVYAMKVRRARRDSDTDVGTAERPVSLHGIEHRRIQRGRVWVAARLVNRLVEQSIRQLVSAWHQVRGRLVIYDRLFLFDYGSQGGKRRLSDRIHRWFLEHAFPKPDLVVLLDAPPDVLYARKPEVPLSYLESRRRWFLERGSRFEGFVVVDATEPVAMVYEAVVAHIEGALRQPRRRFWSTGRRPGSGSEKR